MTTQSQAMDDHAMALGHVACSWSAMQDRLGHLFSAVIFGHLSDVALAAWHCHQNDRAQREMLVAAAKAALQTRPEILGETEELKRHVDGLAELRNDFVHASYALLLRSKSDAVIPDDYYGNKRSKKLAAKYAEGSLVKELYAFRRKLDHAIELCDELYQCVVDPEQAPSLDRPWKRSSGPVSGS